MKKILAMLLVLGLANFANATMSFDLVPTPPGHGNSHGFHLGDPLLPSEWVELDVVYNGTMPLYSSGMLYLTITGTGEWCGDDASTYDPPGSSIEQVWTYIPNFDPAYEPMPGWLFPGFLSMTKVDSKNIEIGGNTNNNSMVAVAPGSTIFDHLNIHCTGPGEIVVTLTPATDTANPVGTPQYWDGAMLVPDLEAVGSSFTIYNIPEPMTMALLGIGGLGLIRRRRR